METFSGKISLREIFLSHGAWFSFWLKNALRLRFAILWNVVKMIRCRKDWGFARFVCPECNHERLVPHTCKSRFCSSCGKVATERWVESTLSSLIDVPYQHLVFTVPAELRDWIQMNRKQALNALFKAAHEVLLNFTAQQNAAGPPSAPGTTATVSTAADKPPSKNLTGYRPGIISVLHTFGADLKFNPHLHLLITCGGLSLDGQNQWRDNSYLHHACLRPMWRYAVLQAFKDLFRAGQLKPPPQHRAIRSFKTFNSYLTQFYQKEWYIHLGHSLEEKQHAVRYVGRYGKRPVIAESRIEAFDGKTVTFCFRDRATNEQATLSLPTEEFIARLVQHIPDEHFRVVRHAGLFANRCRKRLLALARFALRQKAPPPPQKVFWRDLFLRTFGVDPLLCPNCQRPLLCVEHRVVSSAEARAQVAAQAADFRQRAQTTRTVRPTPISRPYAHAPT